MSLCKVPLHPQPFQNIQSDAESEAAYVSFDSSRPGSTEETPSWCESQIFAVRDGGEHRTSIRGGKAAAATRAPHTLKVLTHTHF